MLTQSLMCIEHVRLVCWQRLLIRIKYLDCIRCVLFTHTKFSVSEFRQKKGFLALIDALTRCRHFCSSQQNEEDKHSGHHSR